MRLGFTGHRNAHCDPMALHQLMAEHPGAVWVHGGAAGFDRQVSTFARAHGLTEEVIRPDYRTHHPKRAPLVRNEQIVGSVERLVACWDGRKTGGTFYTINYARRVGVPVKVLRPAQHQEG